MTCRPRARCSPVSGCSISALSGPASTPRGRSSGTTSAEISSAGDSPGRPNMPTSVESTSVPCRESTSSRVGSRARPPAQPASGAAEPTSGGSGPSSPAPFAIFDRATSSWRTSQGSWLPIETTPATGSPRSSRTSLAIWTRSGTWANGTAFPRQPLAPLTSAIVSGSWLPTPAASEGGYNWNGGPNEKKRPSLSTMARQGLWPTPKASDDRSGMASRGGPLEAAEPERRRGALAHADLEGRGLLGQSASGIGWPFADGDGEALAHPLVPRRSVLSGRDAYAELAGLRSSRGRGWWATEPDVGRVAHGSTSRLDRPRLRALGDGVVTYVGYFIGRRLMQLREGEA